MHIVDRVENLDQLGSYTVVPTWENMNKVVSENITKHNKETLLSTMNSNYQEKYAGHIQDFRSKGGDEFKQEQIIAYSKTLPSADREKFLARHNVRTEIGANAEFTGNGLTANTANGGGHYGVVETLSVERDLPLLSELQSPSQGKPPLVKTIQLRPIK